MRYWLISCPRGHCGTGKYTEITFVFKASNLMTAINVAKKMPSVKHNRLPLHGQEISKEEYYRRKQISAYHSYEH